MPKSKIILVNASANGISGGLIVAVDYLYQLIAIKKYHIILVCPQLRVYGLFKGEIQINYVKNWQLKRIFRWYLEWISLPAIIRSVQPDLILTLTNLPVRSRKTQIFLHDNPYITHNLFSDLTLTSTSRFIHALRKIIFLNRIKFVNQYIAQTPFEKDLLSAVLPKNKPVNVLQPFLPFHLKSRLPLRKTFGLAPHSVFKIIFPARYFEHKNFELLIVAAKLIEQKKLPLQIVVTLGRALTQNEIQLHKKIAQLKVGLLNIGHFPPENMAEIIGQCNAVAVPSFIETFGLNCIEAWYLSKPLLIANRPYARLNCGNSALYFDPNNANDFIDKVIDLHSNSELCTQLIENGKRRLTELPTSFDLEKIIDNI